MAESFWCFLCENVLLRELRPARHPYTSIFIPDGYLPIESSIFFVKSRTSA